MADFSHKYCEQTGKRTFSSKNDATHAKYAAERHRPRALRVYECDKCWGWHLTSKKFDKYA